MCTKLIPLKTNMSSNIRKIPPAQSKAITGKYVKGSNNGLKLTKDAIIHVTDKDEVAPVCSLNIGHARDISASLGGNVGIIHDVTVVYDGGDVSTGIPVADCILEYRSNIGTEREYNKGGRKWTSAYMRDYASLGIPNTVTAWMLSTMKENKTITNNLSNANISDNDGYSWFTVKLPVIGNKSQFALSFVSSNTTAGQTEVVVSKDAVQTLSILGTSLIGIATLQLRLKKTGANTKELKNNRYTIGITLASFQATSETNKTGPVINPVTAVAFKDFSVSEEQENKFMSP
jgi:hypothetical protein